VPLVLVIAIVALALMYWRWRNSGLTRNCRWRRLGEGGAHECAFCGARTVARDGRTPDTCLRNM